MRILLLPFLLVIAICLTFSESQAQSSKIIKYQRSLIIIGNSYISSNGKETKKIFVFFGSGFLLDVDGITHLVTAKHVVKESIQLNLNSNITNDSLCAFYTKKDGTVGEMPLKEMQEKFQSQWIFHTNPEVDIAMLPCEFETSLDSVYIIQMKELIETKDLLELDPIFFVSYYPVLSSYSDINPLFRSGIISKKCKDSTLLIDALAFPGNSGSPTFLSYVIEDYGTNEDVSLGFSKRKGLIGVVTDYIPYRDVAISKQTKHTRVIFEENSGIAIVWPSDFLLEISKQENMIQQIHRIKTLKNQL